MKRFVIFSILCFAIVMLSVARNSNGAAADQVSKTIIDGRVGIASIVFSPDGKLLVSGEEGGGKMSVWDTTTGKELKAVWGHDASLSPQSLKSDGSVNSVAFSPDGKMLASGGSDGMIIVWDTERWEKLKSLQHKGSINSVAFSPDGKMLAGGGVRVTIWNTNTWTKLKEFDGHSNSINSVAFSKREMLLASGSADGSIIVWDISTGNKMFILNGHNSEIFKSVDITPDGKTLVSGGNYPNIILWDLNNGALLKSIPSLQGMVNSVKFNQDGDTFVAGFKDGSVAFLNIRTGFRKTDFSHKDTVNSVAFSRDGKMAVTADRLGKIILWDVQTITHSFANPERPLAKPYE